MFLAETIDGQVIVVILMVLFAGGKALIEKLRQNGAPEDHGNEEAENAAYEAYLQQLEEQRIEILRRQQGVTPPPPLPRAAKVPKVSKAQKKERVYTPPKVIQPQLSKEEKAALANFQKGSGPAKKRAHSTARTRALRVLSSPSAARDAIVLSEILGPAKGTR